MERGYVSAGQLNAALLEHVRRGEFTVPASLDLVGYGQIVPSQQALLTELQGRGTVIRQRTLESTGDADRLVASVLALTEGEERLLALRWIREFLETRRTAEPRARVAVLVPNLAEERDQLEGVLREVLAPELQSIDADLSSTPWGVFRWYSAVVTRHRCRCLGVGAMDPGSAAARECEFPAAFSVSRTYWGGCGRSERGGTVRCGSAAAHAPIAFGDRRPGIAGVGQPSSGWSQRRASNTVMAA